MARILAMPSLSPSMETGTLASWAKELGDFIKSGEVIAQIETDKAVVEYEVLDDGYLRHFFIKAGDAVPVGAPIVIMSEEKDDDITKLIQQAGQVSVPKVTPLETPGRDSQAGAAKHHVEEIAPPTPEIEITMENPADEPSGRFKASPLARKVASELGIELKKVRGTGPRGRVIKDDVEKAKQRLLAQPAAAPAGTPKAAPAAKAAAAMPTAVDALEGAYEAIPLTGMRKTIAIRLVEATQTIPHFFLTIKVQVDKLLELRKELNTAMEVKVSVNDMIIKACGNALMLHPQVNTRFSETALHTFKNAHVGFAVATPQGLITPIVRYVNQKGLGQIANETRDMAARAKEKKLAIEEFSGGTFGTSNLGMLGIDQFTAIINPPQACNLAIGQAAQELQLDAAGKVQAVSILKLTLSCDHRVVDGAVGAQFLKTLKQVLENPLALML